MHTPDIALDYGSFCYHISLQISTSASFAFLFHFIQSRVISLGKCVPILWYIITVPGQLPPFSAGGGTCIQYHKARDHKASERVAVHRLARNTCGYVLTCFYGELSLPNEKLTQWESELQSKISAFSAGLYKSLRTFCMLILCPRHKDVQYVTISLQTCFVNVKKKLGNTRIST